MNNEPFGNIHYPSPILAVDNVSSNLFSRNNQAPNQIKSMNHMPGVVGNRPAIDPGVANAQVQQAPFEGITPFFDWGALNKGFAEAEYGDGFIPSHTAANLNKGTPVTGDRFDTGMPAEKYPVASGILMQTNTMLSDDSHDRNITENQSPLSEGKTFNPYADYLAHSQQANIARSNNRMEANMPGPITVAPDPVQNAILPPSPVRMTNIPGMKFPTVQSGKNGQKSKRKSMKATAYDLMSDLISRIPMFTHGQEVYIYDGQNGYYRHRQKYEVEQIIMDVYRPIIREYGSGTLIEKVYKLLLKEPFIVRNSIPLSDPTKISFANCTVDIQNQTMSTHSPANVVTHAITCNLARFDRSSEDCPVFDKFLHDITGGDPVLESRIWEIIGYCLTPDMNAKKYFVFQGARDSGKSLLCNLLSDFFPEAKVSALSVHSLKDKFAKGNLQPFVLCVSPDLPIAPLDSTSTSIIKQITGNDKISAPVKYKSNVQFRFEGKLILASNYPLLTDVSDDAFMQRAVVVPFVHTIPKESQDVTLFSKMKVEKPAIASIALDAYFRLRNNHYEFSGHYDMNSSVMFPDNLVDSPEITPLVYNFLLGCFEKDPEGLVAIESAYEVFSQEVSNQFTEKMFSSVFQRLAEEIYGANRIRSYHGGRFKNARSSMEGIRFRQRTS